MVECPHCTKERNEREKYGAKVFVYNANIQISGKYLIK